MKYKVGDKVKVVKHGNHHFPLRTEGVITDVYEEDKKYEVKGYDTIANRYYYQTVREEDIILIEEPKMPKYTTEPIDYTGCHPVIAEHLKRGESILCRVRDIKDFDWNRNNFMVESYSNKIGKFVYLGYFPSSYCGTSFVYAEPIPIKRKVLMSAEKAVVKLIENGWKIDTDGRVNSPTETKDYYYLSELKRKEGKNWDICKGYPDYLFEEIDN